MKKNITSRQLILYFSILFFITLFTNDTFAQIGNVHSCGGCIWNSDCESYCESGSRCYVMGCGCNLFSCKYASYYLEPSCGDFCSAGEIRNYNGWSVCTSSGWSGCSYSQEDCDDLETCEPWGNGCRETDWACYGPGAACQLDGYLNEHTDEPPVTSCGSNLCKVECSSVNWGCVGDSCSSNILDCDWNCDFGDRCSGGSCSSGSCGTSQVDCEDTCDERLLEEYDNDCLDDSIPASCNRYCDGSGNCGSCTPDCGSKNPGKCCYYESSGTGACNAQCDSDGDCGSSYCSGLTWYYNQDCLSDCTCDEDSTTCTASGCCDPTCSDSGGCGDTDDDSECPTDGWVCTGVGQRREERDHLCSSCSCDYIVTNTDDCNDDDGWYCDPGNVREYRNYGCSGGSCIHSDSQRYDCDNDDGCSGSSYINYRCSSGSCTVQSTDDCSDCSCSCGGYNEDENDAAGNCNDGLDNDCDGNTDTDDTNCLIDCSVYAGNPVLCDGDINCAWCTGDGTCKGVVAVECQLGQCSDGDYCDSSCAYQDCGTNNCPLDGCSDIIFEDYPATCDRTCSVGSCQDCTCSPTTTSNCSLGNNWDGDAIACNCDCGGYDEEESDAGLNCGDGLDNDCDGNTDLDDPDCTLDCSIYNQASCIVQPGCTWCTGDSSCKITAAVECQLGQCSGDLLSECALSCTWQGCGTDACPADGCYGLEDRTYPATCDQTCSGGSCQPCTCSPITSVDCSLNANLDGDALPCNCDCDGYDVPETTANGNCADGKDNDCDGNQDSNDPNCAQALTVDTRIDVLNTIISGVTVNVDGDVKTSDGSGIATYLLAQGAHSISVEDPTGSRPFSHFWDHDANVDCVEDDPFDTADNPLSFNMAACTRTITAWYKVFTHFENSTGIWNSIDYDGYTVSGYLLREDNNPLHYEGNIQLEYFDGSWNPIITTTVSTADGYFTEPWLSTPEATTIRATFVPSNWFYVASSVLKNIEYYEYVGASQVNFSGTLEYKDNTPVEFAKITVTITYQQKEYIGKTASDINGDFFIKVDIPSYLIGADYLVNFYVRNDVEAVYECWYDHITEQCTPQ